MAVTLKWRKSVDQVAKDAAGGDSTVLFMASEARRLMNPYVPMLEGRLADSADVTAERGVGKVTYNQPYARRMYYGEGFRFSHEPHPLATAKWDEAMMAARKDDLIKAVQAFITRKG